MLKKCEKKQIHFYGDDDKNNKNLKNITEKLILNYFD